ncbi:HlyD family secretion protein [Aliiglaciecola lipolytica]|uniref:Secretion protein n=1 Tax=Aliiglaciecola lipolytica E3 TaxID=1127673 RepID=K6XQQ8_9ALTE|nr:HlyD family secretion protein [Aliiglaciecola lipolytica]GAC14026.1 secretion protein [Aliiglaciecola lipolytica E3]
MSSISPKKVVLVTVVILVSFIVIFAMSDAYTPSSSKGVVSANVVELSPRVSGNVNIIHVTDNAVVDAGEPLFTIDSYPYELAVKSAEANLSVVLQNLDSSSASIAAAQASVTQARVSRDNARTEQQRVERLEQSGLIPKADADNARAKTQDAIARFNTAQANLASAVAALGPAGEDNPQFEAASAKLAAAQYDLASTTITAPHKGVITNLNLSTGQYVGAGQPALTFIDAQSVWITLELRENQLRHVNTGDMASVLFDALPGQIFEAKVTSVAWGISIGKQTQDGLAVSQVDNRWFEPARRIPIKIELSGGMDNWPREVKVGGQVHAIIYAKESGNPVGWLGALLQRLRSLSSYLY